MFTCITIIMYYAVTIFRHWCINSR